MLVYEKAVMPPPPTPAPTPETAKPTMPKPKRGRSGKYGPYKKTKLKMLKAELAKRNDDNREKEYYENLEMVVVPPDPKTNF
jgi:hypothetical protein